MGVSGIAPELGKGMEQQWASQAHGLAVPAPVLGGGREHHGTGCGVTHRMATLHVPQRLVLGGYTRELGLFTSDILQLRTASKDDYNSKYNQEAAHHL